MERETHELVPNLQLGFCSFWRVYKEYEIFHGDENAVLTNGRLYHRGNPYNPYSIARSYAPMLHPEIVSEIAKLQPGDEEGVLKFARMYGSFGSDALIPEEVLARGGAVPIGDSLSWIWAHANTIRICSELSYLLQEADRRALKTYIQSLWITSQEFEKKERSLNTQGYLARAIVAIGRNISPLEWGYSTGYGRPDVEVLARMIRRDLINKNIAGIHRMLMNAGKRDCGFFEFKALIETAYWHLANAVDGGRLKRCEAEDCGAVFIQKDPRQHFCPPLIPKHESRCAVRSRVHKHRKT